MARRPPCATNSRNRERSCLEGAPLELYYCTSRGVRASLVSCLWVRYIRTRRPRPSAMLACLLRGDFPNPWASAGMTCAWENQATLPHLWHKPRAILVHASSDVPIHESQHRRSQPIAVSKNVKVVMISCDAMHTFPVAPSFRACWMRASRALRRFSLVFQRPQHDSVTATKIPTAVAGATFFRRASDITATRSQQAAA